MGKATRSSAIAAASAVLLLGLTAADRPSILSKATSGLWELSRGNGVPRLSRQCIADPALLAQIEHARVNCTRVIIRDLPTSAEIHYTCPGGGFGRTTISMFTPRSFRIETQGISRSAPFNYVVQARRVGNCKAH